MEEISELADNEAQEHVEVFDYEEQLDALREQASTEQLLELQAMQAQRAKTLTLPPPRNRTNSRAKVASAMMDTFDLIGGVPRMALWANDYPTEFYRLFAKLAPREMKQEMDASVNIVIDSRLAPGALDEAPTERVINPEG